MREREISSLHRYSNRFLRSTDLVRDFDDPNGLQGYWLTDFGRTCLTQMAAGFQPQSSRRAWRLTGDFGSGKSSFALLLANTVSDAEHRLPKGLRHHVTAELPDVKNFRYVPVLVMGNREPIVPAILRSLRAVLADQFSRGSKSSLLLDIELALSGKRPLTDEEALDILDRSSAKLIDSGKGSGLLLILDEVGKFLEFAAANPAQQDVYFLQRLAEMAARSGKHSVMVVCLLHQGFNAYAEHLGHATQREWEKIAGRFEEILFQQPLDQIALLVSSALGIDPQKVPAPIKSQAEDSLAQAIVFGWFGTSASRETLRRLHHRLFPLDPMLLPVLVRMFHRFAQNERSLFNFLYSHEPFGLRAFSNSPLTEETEPYRLADFFDYMRTNFGHRLAAVSYRAHWNVIESVLEAFTPDDPQELRVLKTVGVLNLLSAEDLLPTQEVICWAVAGPSPAKRQRVATILKKLQHERVLHFRGETRGYSVWPYTSVDIESRLDEAKRALPAVSRVAEAIMNQLDSRPIVARAHYIRTGNLRYFEVIYCSPNELEEKAKAYATEADGVIFVPLCETGAEATALPDSVRRLEDRTDLIQLVAIPRPLSHLGQAALDSQHWEWVQENTPELNSDRFAREEVQVYRQEARNRLQSQIQAFIGLNRITGRSLLTWYFRGEARNFHSGRQVVSWLSELCDNAFKKAPRIKNELVNRNSLSSAAKAARMRLIDLMFQNQDKLDLGMPKDRKPPEKSMYFSVLRDAGLHQQSNGRWSITYPPANHPSKVWPALDKIRETISSQPDTRISIQSLMKTLRQPPYGLREGLFPILLAVVAIADEQEVAFYENGTFLREVGRDAFLRMTRAPQNFDIQYCKIEGVRSELFKRLGELLELPKAASKEPELLDVVRKLCQFVAQLPEYTRNTKRLTASARGVRDIILDAREPVRMVFHDLPAACGFQKFEIARSTSVTQAQHFVQKLKEALDELRDVHLSLHRRLNTSLSKEFGYADQPATQYRKKLAQRAECLLVQVTEPKLKTFAFRLLDTALPSGDWLESMGSVLALRPPAKWKDEDEDTCDRELANMAGRFKRTESAAFASGAGSDQATAIRVAVTRADGTERQEVIHFAAEDQALMSELQDQFAAIISKNKRLGVAAASQALWSILKATNETQ